MNDLRKYINIVEDESEVEDDESRLAAVSQLLIAKSDEQDVESRVSTEAFINILNKMGLPITQDTLMDFVQAEDNLLDDVIKDVNQDYVTFKGKSTAQAAAMTKDKAEDVVKGMANTSAKKHMS